LKKRKRLTLLERRKGRFIDGVHSMWGGKYERATCGNLSTFFINTTGLETWNERRRAAVCLLSCSGRKKKLNDSVKKGEGGARLLSYWRHQREKRRRLSHICRRGGKKAFGAETNERLRHSARKLGADRKKKKRPYSNS